MKEIIYISILFLFVTLNHGIFLLLGKSGKLLWDIHLLLNGTLWLLLLLWIILIQFHMPAFLPTTPVQILGIIFCSGGLLLVINSFANLGFKQAMGYRFFSREKMTWISKGVYSILDNPMYDGFILILIGLGLFRGIMADFYLALDSLIFLNLFLASIENRQ